MLTGVEKTEVRRLKTEDNEMAALAGKVAAGDGHEEGDGAVEGVAGVMRGVPGALFNAVPGMWSRILDLKGLVPRGRDPAADEYNVCSVSCPNSSPPTRNKSTIYRTICGV